MTPQIPEVIFYFLFIFLFLLLDKSVVTKKSLLRQNASIVRTAIAGASRACHCTPNALSPAQHRRDIATMSQHRKSHVLEFSVTTRDILYCDRNSFYIGQLCRDIEMFCHDRKILPLANSLSRHKILCRDRKILPLGRLCRDTKTPGKTKPVATKKNHVATFPIA